MKRISMLITAIAVMIGLLAVFAPSASAEDTPPPPPSCADVNPDTAPDGGTCADIIRESESHSEDVDTAIAAVGTNGKILTRYAVAAGMKLTSFEKNNSHCKLVSKASQIPAGAKCIRGKRGFHFTNSGYTTSGAFTKWADYVGSPGSSTPNAKWMKFVKHGSQWFKVGSDTGGGNCGNKVWFHGPPPKLTWRQVINIKSFANWIFKGSVAVKASALTEALSKSWCSNNGTLAMALARAFGSSNSAASASYQVRGLVQIKQWTNAKAAELKQSLKLAVHAEAEAFAKAKASSDASTKVQCSGPPPTYSSPSVSANASACVEPGQATGIVTVTATNNNDIAVPATFAFPGKASQTATIAANATVTKQFTGIAPGTYSGSVSFGAPVNKSAPFTVTVEECDTPPAQPPVFTQFREFNDLYKSLPDMPTTMDHFVTVDTPDGHSYTITWTAVWGSFGTPTKTGQDGVQVSSTYTAPSEVPPAHPGEGLSAGYDKIKVVVVDNVTGLRIERESAPFRIKEWPTTP